MNRNEAIDAVSLMRTLRAKLSAEMKGMTAQERLDYIRRKARGKPAVRRKAHTGRSKPQSVRA